MGFNFRSIPFVARARPSGGGGPAFSAAFVASSYVNNNTLFVPTQSFSAVPIGAADSTRRLYIWFWTFGGEANTITLSVNGGAGISATEQIRPQGFRQVLLFVADVPTGTTANFVFSTSGTDFQQASMAVVRAVGTHTSATATASPNGTSLDVAINTVAGDTLFVGIMGRQGVANGAFYTPPSGFTEHVDAALKPTDTPNPSAPLFLGSGTAAGGTPQTITTTAADFTESAVLALRLRAS